jgi:hypothetical protein
VKRARVSYGSLFESGYDIFAEADGTVQGKGRKRARFSRKSGAWRYSSRSRSPETSQADEDMVDSGFPEPDEEEKPVMTDEGCQTLGLDDDNAAEALADLSRQQEASVDNAIVAEETPGIHEAHASGPAEDPSRSEVSVDIRPSPMPHVTLQDGNQEESSNQQSPTHNIETSLDRAKTDMVQSDTLRPLDQFNPIAIEEIHPSSPVEIEDLYGLSPTADGYPRSANPETNIDQTIPNHDDAQLMSINDHYEHSHQIGDSHNTIAYPKLPSRSTSPNKIFDSTPQVYPEPDVAANHDFTAHSGPYYGEQLQNYPNISEGQWDMQPEDIRSPNAVSLAEHEVSHDVPMQKMLARHLSPGGVAMSRSQSGHSEMIDLTEDSDEQEEALAEGSRSDDEEVTNEQFYHKDLVEDQPGNEEEGYENILYDNDGSESAEDEFEYDDEDNIRHPPGFHPVKHLAPGEVADDDEDEEEGCEEEEIEEEEFEEEEIEEGSYDNESASDEENALNSIKQPLGGKPEVIDLLSSDEEDGEDDNASRDPSELGESVATRLNETSSMFVEEEESDLEAESDVENSEEVMEDRYAEEDLLSEPDSTKPARMEEPEGLIDESASEEGKIGGADGMESQENVSGLSSNAAGETEPSQDIQLNTRKQISASKSQFTGFGGHDGTSGSLDHLLSAPHEAEEGETTAKVNGEEAPMSGGVTYPVLPIIEENHSLRQEKGTQHEDALGMSRNDQLPTPDATQLSAVMAPDTSFGSINSFQPSLDRMDSAKGLVSETQDSLQQEPMGDIEEVNFQASVTESATDAPEDAAKDTFERAVADAAEQSASGVATIEANHADGQAMMDVLTDSGREVVAEEAPSTASNVAAEVIKDAMIEAIQQAPVTPRRSKRLSFSQQHRERVERSPSINMDEPTTPDDYDASVELAMAALDSPTKQNPVGQQISDKQRRVLLSRPLRTSLGYFTTLKLIRFNLEKKLDILAIVTTHPSEPQRAKNGLRHYHLRFNVTDATVGHSGVGVVSVNIFRPYKTALPNVRPGEVVLLRNFLVKAEKGAGFTLRSDDGSSWVVFKHAGDEEVKGPPVEYGDEERDHVAYLKVWHRNLDANARERLEKANGDKGV